MVERMIPAQMCYKCHAFIEVTKPVTGEMIFKCECDEVVIPAKWREHGDY